MSERRPRVPSVGDDPRDGSPVDDPAEKTWFRDLDKAVIETDRCIRCGSCVAACPSDSIGIDTQERRPTLVKMCTGCSRCWDYCPRSGLRYERITEVVSADRGEPTTYAARASTAATHDAGENGGAVTALLSALLAAGEIDGAVVAESDGLDGEASLATSAADLRETAGSVHAQTMQLGRIDDLVADADLSDPALAVVGTPCVTEGAAALETVGRDGDLANVALTVALMCTASFEADRLRAQIADRGVDPDAVASIRVVGGAVSAVDADGEELFSTALDAMEPATLRGCAECADFAGRAADVSAGTVGSPQGATTLVVRSDRGAAAVSAAEDADALELTELDEDATASLARWNRERADATLPRDLDPEGSLSIPRSAHVDAYEGTDREPEPLNRARVYQYEEWC